MPQLGTGHAVQQALPQLPDDGIVLVLSGDVPLTRPATLQALIAIYDNCNSLHTNAFDEAITTPTEDSVRRAMAIQLIINREWGLAKNENPNQGAFIIDELTERMKLNLKVYSAQRSAAWQEARHGQRWNQGLKGLEDYNQENKVEPMRRALRELGINTWFAGLRRNQAESRSQIPYLEWSGGRWKVHPIAEWSDRDVHRYLTKHGLPYHPLWEKGYVSIGDHHSTKPIHEVATLEETRFFGLKRECGIHEIDLADL